MRGDSNEEAMTAIGATGWWFQLSWQQGTVENGLELGCTWEGEHATHILTERAMKLCWVNGGSV